jgi:hypothetical protein
MHDLNSLNLDVIAAEIAYRHRTDAPDTESQQRRTRRARRFWTSRQSRTG